MPQLRVLFGFFFFLLVTGLTAQSAITANLNVTSGSGTLEGYTDPGKTFITLLSTDAVPIFEARLEIRLSVGQRTYVLNRNGEAGTISLVSNVPTLLQGFDLAEYFTPNALDPFQRQQLLDDGGLLPGGQTSICVALYDPRFPGAPPVSNNACALAYFEYAQPPLLIDQPDPVSYGVPQALNFQWIPQQFFPATYTIEIWDAQTEQGFGQLFIVNNTPPLVQETVLTTQFTLTDFYPLLPPETDYIWRVRAEDLVQNRPFINNGFSELGFFNITSDVLAEGCYAIENLAITGSENEPFSVSFTAAEEAFANLHGVEIRDQNTGLLLSDLGPTDGVLTTAGVSRGKRRWKSGPLNDIGPLGGPLRIEVCITCDNGVDEICEVIVYDGPEPTIIIQDDSPCPPPVQNLSWTLAGENSVTLNWTLEPTATGYTIDLRNLTTPPTNASDAPPTINDQTEQTLDDLSAGDQYRVIVCYECSETGEDRCATLYFVLPDLADCNPVLSPVDIAVTPTTAGFAWDVDSDWVDGYSLRVDTDSVMIPAGQNSYLWAGLQEGTTYAAELCVYCPGGDNTFRNCVNVGFTTTEFICADETMLAENVSISSQAGGGILVDWSALPLEVAVQGGIVSLINPATLLVQNTYTVQNNASFHVFDAPENEPPYLLRFCLECEGEEACYEQTITPPSCGDLAINGLNAADLGSDFAQLYWAGPNGFAVDEYRLRKRLTGGEETNFESIGTTIETEYRLEELLPLRTYELEICFDCDAENQVCDTLEITTEAINCSQAAEEPVEYACGSEADIPEFGQVPLVSHLSPGDSVVAGDFIVLITNVESTGSPWRGSGRIMVPYLNEVELSVDFEAIEVNENCRMTSGEMIVKPPFANLLEDLSDMIDDVTDVLGSVDDILGDILDILNTGGGAADYLEPIIELLEILEEQLDNNPFISPEAETLLEDAILCLQSSIATGNPAACTEILEDLQEALAETYAADYQVPFHRAETQVYGYDTLMYPEMDILNWYPSLPLIGGRPYTAAWASMPEGTGDQTRAVRSPSGSLDSIRFFGADSTEIAATITDNGFDLATNYATSPVIYAVHPRADSTGAVSQKIAGQLSLVAYSEKVLNVVLVPVNGVETNIDADEVQEELQRIFGPAVVEVSVSADTDLPVVGVGIIPNIASGVRQYPAALRKIINTYESERTVDEETYYIFLVEEGENERTGFMPRKKQFGFLFLNRVNEAGNPPGENLSDSEKVARLAGHELGHGAYHLRHTFEEVGGLDAGDTDNLMDYALGGRLHKWQWDFVEDPVGVVGVFEGDDEGSGGVLNDVSSYMNEGCSGNISDVRTKIFPNNAMEITWKSPLDEIRAEIFVKDLKEGNYTVYNLSSKIEEIAGDGKRILINPQNIPFAVSNNLNSELLVVNDSYLTEYQYEINSFCEDSIKQRLIAKTGGFDYYNQRICQGHTAGVGLLPIVRTDRPYKSVMPDSYSFDWLLEDDGTFISSDGGSKAIVSPSDASIVQIMRRHSNPSEIENEFIVDIGEVFVDIVFPETNYQLWCSQCLPNVYAVDESDSCRVANSNETLNVIDESFVDGEFSHNDGVTVFAARGVEYPPAPWPEHEPYWYSLDGYLQDEGESLEDLTNSVAAIELYDLQGTGLRGKDLTTYEFVPVENSSGDIIPTELRPTYNHMTLEFPEPGEEGMPLPEGIARTYIAKSFADNVSILPFYSSVGIQFHPMNHEINQSFDEKLSLIGNKYLHDLVPQDWQQQLSFTLDNSGQLQEWLDWLQSDEMSPIVNPIVEFVEETVKTVLVNRIPPPILIALEKVNEEIDKCEYNTMGNANIEGERFSYNEEAECDPRVLRRDNSIVRFSGGGGNELNECGGNDVSNYLNMMLSYFYKSEEIDDIVPNFGGENPPFYVEWVDEKLEQVVYDFLNENEWLVDEYNFAGFSIMMRDQYDLNLIYNADHYEILTNELTPNGQGVLEITAQFFEIKGQREPLLLLYENVLYEVGSMPTPEFVSANIPESGISSFSVGYTFLIPFNYRVQCGKFEGSRLEGGEIESQYEYELLDDESNLPRIIFNIYPVQHNFSYRIDDCIFESFDFLADPNYSLFNEIGKTFGPYELYPVPSRVGYPSFDLSHPHFNLD